MTATHLTVESDFTTRRTWMVGAIMVAMVGTAVGMVLDHTVWVAVGGTCVVILYAGFVFGLEHLIAQFDRDAGAVRVTRIRRRQEVAVGTLRLEDLARALEDGRQISRILSSAAETRASRRLPAPHMAPREAARIAAWITGR